MIPIERIGHTQRTRNVTHRQDNRYATGVRLRRSAVDAIILGDFTTLPAIHFVSLCDWRRWQGTTRSIIYRRKLNLHILHCFLYFDLIYNKNIQNSKKAENIRYIL